MTVRVKCYDFYSIIYTEVDSMKKRTVWFQLMLGRDEEIDYINNFEPVSLFCRRTLLLLLFLHK